MIEALKIVADSWPIAAMFVGGCGAGMVSYITRRTSLSSNMRARTEAQKELELERIKRNSDLKQIEGSSK